MNSFGLGLVLNFIDNASSGLGNATRAFQSMSATADATASSVSNSVTDIVTSCYALDSIGTTIMGTGSSILNVFGTVSDSVIKAGMEMQGYRAQLSALYGSVEAGEKKIQEIKDYAMSSVFDIQSLIPAVTTMKAVGIEAMEEITTSSGQHTQRLLDYASDIAAMVPNMRNTYGTGVQAAMGALKEYIAEGNAMSLKRGAGLDIKGILGEDQGKTMEDRTRQVADLVEKLNIVGYTASLAGTPTQRLSNMQDALFNSLTKIADSGVFEKYCNLLEKLSNWVFSLVDNEESFNIITGVLADTVNAILSPLQSLLDILIKNGDIIIEWIKAHPTLTKNILLTVAAIGAFLVAGGAMLKLISSIGMAYAGLMFLSKLPAILTVVGTAFKTLFIKAIPFLSLAGLIYYAWKGNMFGVRDTVTKVINDLGTIFSILSDAWADNTLSEEQFQKAYQLGILPFIEGILQLKYYWGIMVKGFKTGFKSFFEGISESLSSIGIFDVDINALISTIGKFLKSLVEVGAEENWSRIGKALGEIAGALVIFTIVASSMKVILPVISSISKLFVGVGKVIGFVWGIVKILFNPLIQVLPNLIFFFKDLGAAISLVKEGFSFFSVMGAWFPKLAGIVAKFGSIFAKIGGVVSTVGSAIMGVFTAIAGVLGISVGWVVAIVVAIIGAVTALTILIVKNWDKIKSFLVQIPEWVRNHIIIPVRNFFSTVLNFIVGLAVTVWEAVRGFFAPIANWIYEHVIKPISDLVTSLWDNIVTIWSQFISWIFNNIITPVVGFFTSLWGSIVNIVTNIYNGICEILTPVGEWVLINVIEPVSQFFTDLWTGITEIFDGIYESITGAFQEAYDFVVGLWEGITGFFGGIWDRFSGWVNRIVKKGEDVTGIDSKVPAAASGVKNFVGGLIQVNEQGGELITLPSGSTVIPHDQSLKDSLERGISIGADSLAMYANKNKPAPAQGQTVQNDYSVTFSAGSIVIQLANATEAELEKAAEKLMKIIERKQKLKAMAVRA